MKDFPAVFFLQLRRLLGLRRVQIMTALLLVMTFLSVEVYHTPLVQGIPVAVIDQDNSTISRSIRTLISTQREVRIVEPPIGSLEEAREMLVSGEIGAAVVIPLDLSADIKRGRHGTVTIAVDMSNILIGKNAYKALATAVGTVAGGVQLSVVKKLGERKEMAMARVAPVTLDVTNSFNPTTNYGVYILPGMVFFFLHVYLLILATSVFAPFLRPDSKCGIVAYLLAGYLLSLVLGLYLFYVLLPYEGVVPQSSFIVVLVSLLVFLLLDVMMVLTIRALVPSDILAMEATIVFGMLSLMLSGITYPMDMFPRVIAFFAQLNPFTPFARGFQVYLHAPTTFADLGHIYFHYGWLALLFLVGMGIGLGVMALQRRSRRARG